MPRPLLFASLSSACLLLLSALPSATNGHRRSGGSAPAADGCLQCHAGIEPMHPEAFLSCTDCHGGNASAVTKLEAHVRSAAARTIEDETVAPLDADLAWRRFRNPMDLRVAESVCGECHPGATEKLRKSLHGTTAGHLSDGFYEIGLNSERRSTWAVFPERNRGAGEGELESLLQVPGFQSRLPRDRLSTHYTDLARKECMHCHLWSEGRALRGRIGFDGDYRGQGCAACHVAYALDGLSDSADRTVPKGEPGHPLRHELTRAPSTQSCTSCHWGDASIGLHFRGLSQLPPGAPGGPDIPGTTDRLVNRTFYLDDPELVPPDVHHERGMHCIDCHTQADVMGDGRMVGRMEDAVEISCEDCHGGFTEPARLSTRRGTRLTHLSREGEEVWLTSKVTGARHRVPQVVHVLDPARPEFNADAVHAMTEVHTGLECYTCHAGWNSNFLGFHFDRNETLSQLDLLSGQRTPGRVTTQEKVFATWKSFYAGRNSSGRIAPYLTGFSTMGSVTDAAGERILDQELAETAIGLSGMTMIHHQLHSTRPTARSCVECHRNPATWGMGSANFRLARQLAFVADRRGIEVVALDRQNLASSLPLTKLVLPDVTALALDCDPLQGRARWLYVAEGRAGVHVVDVRDPIRPQRKAFLASVEPRGLALAGSHLYVADGAGGLLVLDVSEPERPRRVARLPTFDAHEVELAWPWAFVADGPAGLAVVDVRAPIAPRMIGAVDTAAGRPEPGKAIEVSLLFQHSRPTVDRAGRPADRRTEARLLVGVLDEIEGLVLVDATEPSAPFVLQESMPSIRRSRAPVRGGLYRGLVLASHVDLAERQGGQRTAERDYAYLLFEAGPESNRRSTLQVWDISAPSAPSLAGRVQAGETGEMLVGASFYNPPFLSSSLLAAGSDGITISDIGVSKAPVQLGAVQGLREAWVIAVEEFPLDRMLDEDGRRLKDVSHEGSRWLYRAEIERVLSVPAAALLPEPAPEVPGRTRVARRGDPRQQEPSDPDPAASARRTFAQLDLDGSGFLDGDEARAFLGGGADLDGDGRVTLAELCEAGGGLRPQRRSVVAARPRESSRFRVSRIDFEGDLSRLLDGLDPKRFDLDGDARLDRTECRQAFFAALDLDGDGRLSRDELSRMPGETRALRWPGRAADVLWSALDVDASGLVDPREFRLPEPEFAALDANGDGKVQLEVVRNRTLADAGLPPPRPEWPVRRERASGLPPVVSVERLLATFDEDRDGKLSRRELRRRPDLLQELDVNDSGALERGELEAGVDYVGRRGVDSAQDGFHERWDLDGDGSVGHEELVLPAWVRLRLAR